MTAPRATSLRALHFLSRRHTPVPALRRGLHITGSNSASFTKSADRTSLYITYSLTDLQSECQRRSLQYGGTKNELIERLANNDALQSRAFSIAMRRINSSGHATTSSSSRNFNTSRSSKAVNDSSTVDFAYMPSMHDIEPPALDPLPRVPVLPEVPSSAVKHTAQTPLAEEEAQEASHALKPQVYTVAGGVGAEVSASPMSEVVDNLAVDIDPFSLTEAVGKSRFGEELQREKSRLNGGGGGGGGASARGGRNQGIVGELWSGMLEDLLGPKQGQPRMSTY